VAPHLFSEADQVALNSSYSEHQGLLQSPVLICWGEIESWGVSVGAARPIHGSADTPG